MKRQRLNSIQKHKYPLIPPSAEDELSNKTNLDLLREECDRPKHGDPSKVKELFVRTHSIRRKSILSEESDVTFQSILQDFKMLEKTSYVSAARNPNYFI